MESGTVRQPSFRAAIVQVCVNGKLEDGEPALHVGSYVRNQHIPGLGAVRMLDGAYRAEACGGG
jgi:hypothetical protein